MTNYAETLDYLFSQLPMFTRIGASAIKNNLDNTIALCDLLGNPHKKFKSVHIAGTNGKGSTSHMLAAILQTAGYKTGLYTSPHLKDFRERIRINGQMITEQTVIDFVEHYKVDFERIQPSFFEMTVALAFDVFAKEQVDIAIIEVGLGGRLDSTNVITPLLSLITNIGWDHMNMLGNTLPEIAGEKAGIIKPNIPVIISERQDEVAGVFIKKAAEVNAPITFAADCWQVEVPDHQHDALTHKTVIAKKEQQTYKLDVDLTGTYQQKNIKGVLEAVEQLREQGFIITNEHIERALKQVKILTGLHGRWEVLSTSPLTICDTGHNPDGVQEVLKNIANVNYHQLHFVIGMVNDKDISKVLAMLPPDAIYYFCKPNIPRGLAAEELQATANTYDLKGATYPSVKAALEAAQTAADTGDLVFAGGSTFVVAEIVE
ncbi:bifunctional folylpolyglutamate synthase/dihydrofolate synthase [Mucilaginibacter roseus]|uniref:Dihydrofolate synthase/folylpolyglutamate synthase n=1 Tax=Mucilaginibacter roseus TaxID=1528868 RepID=A0ABS8U3Q4_9SPHI|nr:folylpolyglutamate synthase/dihydrofolate synthase family protein [Mucilaginibacter roseus]MCD8741760.1 bifunctional folylpolyglutamate synthase/dihydrofolate synthase [Mucilaginibacter roseus]